MIYHTDIVRGPNPKVKEFIEKNGDSQDMWNLYGFICDTFPDIRRFFTGEIKEITTDNPAIQKMIDAGLIE